MRTRWYFPIALAALVGCGPSSPSTPPPTDDVPADKVEDDMVAVPDAQPDAQPDARPDVAADASPDVAADAAVDAPADKPAPPDASPDASPDATADASPDATLDATTDAAADAAADAAGACGAPLATISLPGAAFMRDGMTSGASRIAATMCQMNASGPEDHYTLTVTARTVVNIDTEGTRTEHDTVLSLRRACGDAASELACDDDHGRDVTSRLRALLEPGTYSLLVDGYSGDEGPYALAARSAAPAANGACAAPAVLAPGATLAGQATAGASVVNSECTTGDGAQLFYSVTVPANSAVTVRATPAAASGLRPVLRVKDTCAATACVGTGAASAANMPASVLVANAGAMPRTFVLTAGDYGTVDGAFDLSASAATMLAANAACAAPAVLAPGATLAGQATSGAAVSSSECTTAAGRQLFYSVTVPANSAVTVTATPAAMSGLRPVLRMKDTCAATTCVGTGTASAANMPAATTLTNASAAARTYVLSAADYGTAEGTFSLSASAPAMLAANANCAAPTPIAPGATLTAQNSNAGGPRTTECVTANGAQLYYQVTVPAMSAVTVRATPSGTPAWTPVLRARDTCAATACAATNTATAAGMPAGFVLNNGGAAARTFLVSVAGSTAAGGAFDLAATAAVSLVPGATCESPAPLTAAAPAMGVDATRASSATPNRCQTAVTGLQTYFSVAIPPRQRATLRATPTGATAWAPTIRAIAACATTTCLDSRVGASGMPTVLAVDNAGAFPQTILVSVAGASPSAAGTFDLTLTLADLAPPAAYTFATIPGACDNVSTGTAVTPVNSAMMPVAWTDDSISPTAALPFAVQLHGAAASHYAVTSNGLLQLFPNAMGAASTAYTNATIPASAAPNNYVAPFWDDLRTAGSMTVGVRVATLGTAPNRRFVAQWTDWTLPLDETARLTFQAKLFETTNVVEFHYCTLTAATAYVARATGAEATIGVENAAGDNGLLVGFNRVGTASTGTAFRLTPRAP